MKNIQTNILEGWREVSLGDALNYEQPYKYAVLSTEYSKESGIPVLTAGKSFILGYTNETENIYTDFPVIIFDDFTTDSKFVDFPFKVKSSAMKFLKPKNENEHSIKFLFEIVQSLRMRGTFGDHKRRWISEFSKIKIFVPDFKEQTQIASILSKADKAIEQTKNLIAKYQRIKTGLMQDLLTKGIDENGNIRSEQTHKFKTEKGLRVPEEWGVDVIDNLGSVTKLAGYEYSKYFNYSIGGEIIALRALNIKNEEVILDNIQTIPKKTSDFLVRSKIYKNDILVTYIGAYIGDVVLINENDKYHLAPNIAKVTSGRKLFPQYLEILMRSYLVQSQMKNLVVTTATPSLTMGQIRKIILAFPSDLKEQTKIVDAMISIKNSLILEKKKLHKLQSLKTGLMQDLLSGKVRVKTKEEVTA